MTTVTHSIDDLCRPANERFHRIDWAIQRLFRLAMLLLLVAGLLGFLGQGPAVWRTAVASDESLAIDYYAVERYASPTQINIRLREIPQAGALVELRVSRHFCDHTTPEHITPQPLHQRVEGSNVVYAFRFDDPDNAEIVYRYQHQDAGRLAYEISLPDRSPVALSQWVLP